MFAVIRTGSKQYRVAKNDVIAVEKLAGEPGDAIQFHEVLMIGEGAAVETGAPLLAGAAVSATVVEQTRAAKIIVFKKKRRHNYRRKKGHRQHQTLLRIEDISGAGFAPAATEHAAAEEEWPAAQEGPAVESEAEATGQDMPAADPGAALDEGVSDGT
ncbi:MAG: 50S ribosomal protein L21 [Alphaproteobacteria bacterium]|nr:50S ribosomal protein L21 [Alphaproteobacteria bacterium]